MLSEFEKRAVRKLADLKSGDLSRRADANLYSGVTRFSASGGWVFDVFIDAGEWDYFDTIEGPEEKASFGEFSDLFSFWQPYLQEEERIWGLPGHCRKFEEPPEVSAELTVVKYKRINGEMMSNGLTLLSEEHRDIQTLGKKGAEAILTHLPFCREFSNIHFDVEPRYRHKDLGRTIIRELVKDRISSESIYQQQATELAFRMAPALSAELLFKRPYIEQLCERFP